LDNSKNKVCCFGEILLRFSPKLKGEFIKSASMPVYIGGAELNVATALANWNKPVKYITAMPDNYLSKEIIDEISNRNIDSTGIKLCGNRIGAYYLPQGADLKNTGVIYDRSHTSFASLKRRELDWDTIFEDVNWFHFSAISPALNEDAAAICLEALQAASKKNITISIDLNYRAKLWQYGKNPIDVMPKLVEYCNVIMGNIWSMETMLGIPISAAFKHDYDNKNVYLQESTLAAKLVQQRFLACHTVANTFRFDVGEGIKYFAAIENKAHQYSSSIYKSNTVIDRIGSGDCFMAGLIYGLINKQVPQHIIEYAAAAAFSKLQQIGDATTSTINDIKKIILNNE